MPSNDDVLTFSFGDEYDEEFLDLDKSIAESEADMGQSELDALDKGDDGIEYEPYSEMFDDFGEISEEIESSASFFKRDAEEKAAKNAAQCALAATEQLQEDGIL